MWGPAVVDEAAAERWIECALWQLEQTGASSTPLRAAAP
jgi:hypothetical protein